MINTQKIGVLLLSVIVLLCIPLHIFLLTHKTAHTHMHHAEEHVVTDMFTHLGEMTHAPWVFSFLSIVGAVLFFAYYKSIDDAEYAFKITQRAIWVPYVHKKNIFKWKRLHKTSPPLYA